MSANGIMEEIRSLFAQGFSSREVIDLDFRPGTVYKVLRQIKRNNLREEQKHTESASVYDDKDDQIPDSNPFESNPFLDQPELESVELPKIPYSEEPENQEVALLRSRLDQAEEAQSLQTRVTELERQLEFSSGQIALWQEGWEHLMPLVTSLCTQAHCSDSVMVATHLPTYLKQRSDEAMAAVRKFSKYKGEEIEQSSAIISSLNLSR